MLFVNEFRACIILMKNIEIGGMKIKATTVLVAAIAIILSLTAQTAHAQNVGETAHLKSAGMGTNGVPVFNDSKALDAFYVTYVSDDGEGANELISSRRAFIVHAGTKVRILSGGFSTMEIRVMEGPFSGRRGFVSRPWVSEK